MNTLALTNKEQYPDIEILEKSCSILFLSIKKPY